MRAPETQLRILLIEDQAHDLDLIRQAITRAGVGCEVRHVESERDFADQLEHFRPAVILSDHGVAGFDGFTALELTRRKAPHIPFIFVTGSLAEEDIVRALKTGAADLVLKSRLEALPGAVRRALEEAEAVGRRREEAEGMRQANQELERRAAERTVELEATNKELEAFSYSVSHDLRAPLRHIEGFVEILSTSKGAGLDDESRRYLQMISQSARQMARLIDDLLAFSRTGRAELRKTRLDTRHMVDEVIRGFSDEVHGREIQWKLGALAPMDADPALLKQVWTNLLSNALKYTRPRNPAVIEIGSEPGSQETTFFVRDNGVGFDMRYASKLFGVFQRLHRAADFEGTGVGLANVRRIIHRHNGRTWAEGEVGAGATFYFTLPVTTGPADTPAPP